MLNKARSTYEALKSSWNSGGNDDDFKLALYAAAEDEYNSGNVHKGLLAKINVDTNYDENLSKAQYIKARVDILLQKRDDLNTLMARIATCEKEISNIKIKLRSLEQADTNQLESDDLAKAEADHKLEIEKAIHEERRDLDNNEVVMMVLSLTASFIVIFSILAFGSADTRLPEYITTLVWVFGILLLFLIIRTHIQARKLKKELAHRIDQTKRQLEQEKFIDHQRKRYQKLRQEKLEKDTKAAKKLIVEKENERNILRTKVDEIFRTSR